MSPQEANELLNALGMATAACTSAMGQVDHYTDLYEQLEDTRRQLKSTADSIVSRFIPPIKQRTGYR